jgi:hypothetical protein
LGFDDPHMAHDNERVNVAVSGLPLYFTGKSPYRRPWRLQ